MPIKILTIPLQNVMILRDNMNVWEPSWHGVSIPVVYLDHPELPGNHSDNENTAILCDTSA